MILKFTAYKKLVAFPKLSQPNPYNFTTVIVFISKQCVALLLHLILHINAFISVLKS